MSLETPFNGSLAARQPDRELDLILEGRERRDTREIVKQSPQRLLKCCEVGRLHGDVAFRLERRGRGPRDFERHYACEPVVVQRVASLTLPLVALDVQSQMEPVAAQIDLHRILLCVAADLRYASACAPSAASPSSSRGSCPVALGAVCLRADDEGLDVVPSIPVGIIRDALLERAEEVRDETGGAVLAFTLERAMQERPAPGKHAPHVLPREYGGVFVPVGIVETEELGARELEARDA